MRFFVGTAGWTVPKQQLALFSAPGEQAKVKPVTDRTYPIPTQQQLNTSKGGKRDSLRLY
jgi:hypothetical protein